MGSAASIRDILGDLDKESYINLLTKLIGETEFLQNNPPDLIPQEDRAVKHVLDVLSPLGTDNGGPLEIQHVTYSPGRGNLIIKYPGTESGKVVSFVGSHFDVVTADRGTWDFEPFELSIDGDKLQGRGTTDCLGHVALITILFKKIAEKALKLKNTIVCIFIASEENNSIPGIGVEQLWEDGYFADLKNGPLYWVDTSDSQPCIGTGGSLTWSLLTEGKLFHSGFPDKAINPMELGSEALKVMQSYFYRDFPHVEQEDEYGFPIPSTMKPTAWSYPGGSLNQIPAECTIEGDVRLTPFYDMDDLQAKLKGYKDYINTHLEILDTRGPVSKYILPDGTRGKLTLDFGAQPISGVACDITSRGYKVLCKATTEVVGFCKPYSLTGSLPLIRDLKDNNYDVLAIGYGLTDTYHADNEYCNYSDIANGYKVFASVIAQLEED